MPDWRSHIHEQLRSLRLEAGREMEITEELAQHLEDRYQELRRDGATEERACAGAIEELNVGERLAGEMRKAKLPAARETIVPTAGRGRLLAEPWQDLRYAVRMLRKSPGFTATAVLTLALGIGANAAIYSVLHAAFFARYPLNDPDELLRLYGEDTGRKLAQLNMSVPKFQFVRDQQTVFSGFGGANYNGFALVERGDPVQVNGAFVTANFLQTFGAAPVLGR